MATEPTRRLDGWKAIADYLGRDVRTAQRWRDERGLPVHRVPGGRSATVFADRGELDDWLFQTKVPVIQSEPSAPADAISRSNPVSNDGHVSRRYAPRAAWVIAAVLAVITIALALKLPGTAKEQPPARFELIGNTLVAHAADESTLWSFPLPLKPGSSIDHAVVGEIKLGWNHSDPLAERRDGLRHRRALRHPEGSEQRPRVHPQRGLLGAI